MSTTCGPLQNGVPTPLSEPRTPNWLECFAHPGAPGKLTLLMDLSLLFQVVTPNFSKLENHMPTQMHLPFLKASIDHLYQELPCALVSSSMKPDSYDLNYTDCSAC